MPSQIGVFSQEKQTVRVGGVVLCGGKSSRMGRPKALLPWGNETLLQRTIRLLSEAVTPVVIVAADQQTLPQLPKDVAVVRDEAPELGPLEGIRAGLTSLQDRADAAYVTSCDAPLLLPDFVRALIARLETHDAVVPVEGKFHHPLSAVYRVEAAQVAKRLLASDSRRPLHLIEAIDSHLAPVDELKSIDPQLQSLVNLNTPEAYERALREWGEL